MTLLRSTAFVVPLTLFLMSFASCRKKEAPPAATAPTADQIGEKARTALSKIQSALWAEQSVNKAELRLASQRTVGATQLETIHLQEIQAEAANTRSEAETAMNALLVMEIQTGDRTYTDKIDEYNDYAKRILRNIHLDNEYGSHPSRDQLDWESVKYMTLTQVTNSNFADGNLPPTRRPVPKP